MSRKSFYIIDGHAHIYRAYFAPFRDLTSPTGEPTKATYVFTQMLLNLIEQRKPDYLAMVIDSGDEKVFRKAIYPAYKANRPAPPDDFKPQEQRILRLVKDAGVPIYVAPGFEADDLIATMATQLCEREDIDVYLVSKDKDLRQLLTSCVHMFDVQTNDVIDVQKMTDKLGYGPQQAVDVQTLMGDAIDNVPGIPGVGEKTAVKLLNTFGSIQGIVDNADKLTPKQRENVLAYADKLDISRQLVTLKRDVPFDWSLDACAYRGLRIDGLRPHLIELDFRALQAKLETLNPKPKPEAKPRAQNDTDFGGLFDAPPEPSATVSPTQLTSAAMNYTLVNTPEALSALSQLLRQQPVFAFDTETTSIKANEADLVGLSFSFAAGAGYYVPVRGPMGSTYVSEADVLRVLQPILEDESVGKVGHNIKYDMLVLRQAGVRVRGVRMDTMIAAFLLDASRMTFGIDKLALDLLNFKKIPTTDLIGAGKNQRPMQSVDLTLITRYASEDADICLRLYELLSARLDAIPALRKLNDDIETPLITVLTDMENAGVSIDPAVLKEQSLALGERIDSLRTQIHQAVGIEFNIDSPKQLADVLFTRLNLKTQKKTKTGFSTDIEVLERLAGEHVVPKLVLEYRSLVKLKGTYLDSLHEHVSPRDGRVHTSFNQTGAATGRLSSSDPNLQNIPIRSDEGRRIRLAFVPQNPVNQVLLSADYSQIELRVLAHLSGEPALSLAFANGVDVHSTVASEVFNVPLDQVTKDQRNQAKVINFGIIYGVTAQGLARRIDGLDISGAANLIASYNKRFARVQTFMQECVEKAKKDGYVETIVGRRRPIFDIHSGVIAQRNAAERVAINSVVQGSAADLIKIAMVNISNAIKTENRPLKMLLQVHDELVFETPVDIADDNAAFVREKMISAIALNVPLEVEVGIGINWGQCK